MPLLLLLLFMSAAAAADPRPLPLSDEVLGLVVFKSAVADRAGALTTWTESDASPCGWAHVECDPTTSRVVRLALDGAGLAGRLDPRGLARLSSLASISLSGNNFSSDLPLGFSLLPQLKYLDVSSNALSGALPGDLAGAAGLRYLDLSRNQLTGTIPAALPPALRFLMLSDNQLDGGFPSSLPASLLHLNLSRNGLAGDADFARTLWPLSRLRVVDVSGNQLSGAIAAGAAGVHNLKSLDVSSNRFSGRLPADIGLLPHLASFDAGGNAFSGEVPETYRFLSSLTRLSLPDNRLSGDVPAWIGNLSALQYLDLSNNQLAGVIPDSVGELKDMSVLNLGGNAISGEIPAAIAGCEKLAELRLQGNRLAGEIPQAVFDLGLDVVDLSGNELSGRMPPASARTAETLRWLDLSNNRLAGALPAETALFFNLQYLNLSGNALKAALPPELGLFRNLSVLDLRSAGLVGAIPGDICESGSLAVLQLDNNALTGGIPPEIGNCSSLYLLSLAHNRLAGTIPASVAECKRLKILRLEYNAFSGEIPPQLGGLESLLAVNVSHNQLSGRLPAAGIFPSLDASAIDGNLGVCSPLVKEPCQMNVPKPLVLDPDEVAGATAGSIATDGAPPAAVPRRRRFLSVSSIVAISAALLIVLGVLLITLLNVSARRRMETALESMCSSSTAKSSGGGAAAAPGKMVIFGPRGSFRSEDLPGGAEALLSKATEVGRGVFGTVYKASVPSGGRAIAVKKLVPAAVVQHYEDFDREARTLGMAKHPNVAPVRGYYWTPETQLLLSDFASRGSLEDRLHGGGSPLSWSDRFSIILGTAKGLAYLHKSFRPPIIHYNLKPSNILLDEKGHPRIADYGLARLLPKLEKHVVGSRFNGAAGYVAPELACQSLQINEKCDIYGFGALILELVTGRRPVEYADDDVVILVDQIKGFLEDGNVGSCVDAAIVAGGGGFPEEEVLPVLKLGLVCTSQIPSNRPSMAEVVQILQVIKTPVEHRMAGDGA